MSQDEVRPIIVIKKKAAHHGHHGGAWKVAYADFVTAMMAFFMVMWLMNSTPKVKEAVAGYFNDPVGYSDKHGSGRAGSGEGVSLTKDDMGKLKGELERAISAVTEFNELKDHVSMTVTGEGLRIELIETEKGLFFDSGNALPSQQGEHLLVMLAGELSKLPNHVLIEGHTDARPYAGVNGYSNWELSADRANAARKLMESKGLRQGQVVQVRGFADRRLRQTDKPEDASNRRVSVIVQYLPPKESPADEAAGKGKESGHGADGKGKESGHGAGGKADSEAAKPAAKHGH